MVLTTLLGALFQRSASICSELASNKSRDVAPIVAAAAAAAAAIALVELITCDASLGARRVQLCTS